MGTSTTKIKKMSETITIYSPVFSIHFEDANFSELCTVSAICLGSTGVEQDAVVALKLAILERLKELVSPSDDEVKRIQAANTAAELALVLDIKSHAEFVSPKEKQEYCKKNLNSISYEHTVWIDFKLNKQVIKLPPGKVLVAQSLCNKVDMLLAQVGSKPDWVNDDPFSVKRPRIN